LPDDELNFSLVFSASRAGGAVCSRRFLYISTTMLTEKSFTRLTLGLDIIRRIPEGPLAGYHELNIIKHQIALYDIVSVEPASSMEIICDHPLVPRDKSNVCWRAVEMIRTIYGIGEYARIHILKNIPVQGGLAGGSANAATTISLLDRMWNLNLPISQKREIGRSIGMDVPFFFPGGTAFDTEATGILESIDTKLHFDFILYLPSFGVSTAIAYRTIDYSAIAQSQEKTRRMRLALEGDDALTVADTMHNDFEHSVFPQWPDLAAMKAELLAAGCLNAMMSGSGSSLIGLARDSDHAAGILGRIRGRAMHVTSR
jgi:4-diphosphocytidyl-2-C-methyl-D-erythritol kinase